MPFWSLLWPAGRWFRFRTAIERTEALLAMGLDDTLRLEVPHPVPSTIRHDPLSPRDYPIRGRQLAGLAGVATRVWREKQANDSPARIVKEHGTPAGTLRQVVRESDVWVAGLEIPLMGGFADVNVSSGIEYAVKGPEDLDRLHHLLQPPSDAQLDDFYDHAEVIKRFASRRGVLVEGGWSGVTRSCGYSESKG